MRVARYDLVVIGSGSGGYVAAIRAAQLGLQDGRRRAPAGARAAPVSTGAASPRRRCSSTRTRSRWRRRPPTGASRSADPSHPRSTWRRVHARKNGIVAGLTRGIEYLFKKHGIDWLKGTARLAGAGRIAISGDTPRDVVAREILVATGSAPRRLAGVTIDGTRIITSDEAIHLPAVPSSIAILGSGAVGRRVRLDLPAVRRRGDRHRAAAAARAERGRGGVGGAGEGVPEARHRYPDGDDGHRCGGRGRPRVTCRCAARRGKTESLVVETAARGRRPRTGDRRARRRRRGPGARRPGVRDGRRAVPHAGSGICRPSAT